jgi:GT2 family glycosyltransferase
MNEISVIIVSWNAKAYLRDCLKSIRETGGSLIKEVIVVDNASRDGSPDMVAEEFPEVVLMRSTENLGFARANNLGIKRASAPLIALVNSDVIVRPGCFQELVSAFEADPKVGLGGPKVFGGDGLIQHSCGRLPTIWNTTCRLLGLDRVLGRWRLFSGFQMRDWKYDCRAEVEVLNGCFWLARRAAVDQIGGLDEQFFFYAEDIDWCKRFRDGGWKLLFVVEATATHFGGGSSSNAPLRYSIEMLRGNLLYWKKHHGSFGRLAFRLIAMTRYGVRFLAGGFLRLIGLAGGDSDKQKIKEAKVCLRWLLTGKGV